MCSFLECLIAELQNRFRFDCAAGLIVSGLAERHCDPAQPDL